MDLVARTRSPARLRLGMPKGGPACPGCPHHGTGPTLQPDTEAPGMRGTLWISALAAAVFMLLTRPGLCVEEAPAPAPFQARVGEPVRLEIGEIAPETAERTGVRFSDFAGDWRVAVREGRRVLEVAPWTHKPGRINGEVQIFDGANALGGPVRVSGEVAAWVRASPPRIFLGSTGHGAPFDAVREFAVELVAEGGARVTGVDFVGIPGGVWERAGAAGIILRFAPAAVADGVPYGALARKLVRLRTDHPRQPELLLPVTAMVSVNSEGRDYNGFRFKGAPRWQGWWGTPNIAAAAVAPAALLLLGGALAAARLRGRALAVVAGTVLALGAGGCLWLLAATYSRGGWIAFGAGAAAMALAGAWRRMGFWAGVAAFAVFVAAQPHGAERAASASDIEGDRSIRHRLWLWQAALQAAAEHPWGGVGAGKFGEAFDKVYRRQEHTETYSTAINDYLTVAAERGIVAGFGLVAGAVLGVWAGIAAARGNAGAPAAGCAGAWAASCVAAWFSSVTFSWRVAPAPLLAGAGILVFGIMACVRAGKPWRGRMARVLGGSVAAGVLLLASATVWALAEWPERRDAPAPGAGPGGAVGVCGGRAVAYSPRWRKSRGVVIYLGDAGEEPESLARCALRPLAQRGWEVLCWRQPAALADAVADAVAAAEAISARGAGPVRFAGHRTGGWVALLAGARAGEGLGGVAAVLEAPPSTPFGDEPFRRRGGRVLVAHHRDDAEAPMAWAGELRDALAGAGWEVGVRLLDGGYSKESPRWLEWISAADGWFGGGD